MQKQEQCRQMGEMAFGMDHSSEIFQLFDLCDWTLYHHLIYLPFVDEVSEIFHLLLTAKNNDGS